MNDSNIDFNLKDTRDNPILINQPVAYSGNNNECVRVGVVVGFCNNSKDPKWTRVNIQTPANRLITRHSGDIVMVSSYSGAEEKISLLELDFMNDRIEDV